LRKLIITAAALAVVGGGATAFAAGSFNTYTATQSFSPLGAGSATKPVPFSVTEDWKASGTSGHPAAPLTKIVAKVYGMKTNAKDFPICTASTIDKNSSGPKAWNKNCPGGETGPAMIGQGPVTSEFVSPNPPYAIAGTCNPYLYIYNGGNVGGKDIQVFFFVEDTFSPNPSKYTCLGGNVHTGAAPAYNGQVTYSGKTYTLTIPLPASVSTNAGGTGLYASLLTLHVNYAKKTTKVGGNTVGAGESIACVGKTRPYEFDFTAQNYNGLSPHTGTVVVKHNAAC